MFKKLLVILLVATVLRCWNIESTPHFADIDWFIASAEQALQSGHLPTLGITASITWLHQGPLWTYMLLLPTAVNIPPQAITILAGIAAVALSYFSAGWVAAAILAVMPFAIVSDQTPYHTALISIFFFVSYLCLVRGKSFWGGLFIGFLYQSHLLTFIYWPLFIYLTISYKRNVFHVLVGFALGIMPFILSGPIQSFGIFIWMAKQLLTGLGGISSGISTAYWQVLLPGGILALGWVIKWLYAHGRSLGKK